MSSLLDVGTLLVMLIPEEQLEIDTILGTRVQYMDRNFLLVPLGKILEVFGPVGNPLYALRLAPKKAFNIQDMNELKSSYIQQETKVQDEINGGHDDDKTKGDDGADDQYEATAISQQVHSETESRRSSVIDSWSEKGPLTIWLQNHPKTEVFYFRDQAMIVDTKLVAQNSRKGCGTLFFFPSQQPLPV